MAFGVLTAIAICVAMAFGREVILPVFPNLWFMIFYLDPRTVTTEQYLLNRLFLIVRRRDRAGAGALPDARRRKAARLSGGQKRMNEARRDCALRSADGVAAAQPADFVDTAAGGRGRLRAAGRKCQPRSAGHGSGDSGKRITDPNAPDWAQGIDLVVATHTLALINVLIAGMVFYMVGVTLMLGEVIPLDRQFKVRELLDTLPISRAGYLGGKLLSAWAGLLLGIVGVGVISAIVLRLIFGEYDLRVFAALWVGAAGAANADRGAAERAVRVVGGQPPRGGAGRAAGRAVCADSGVHGGRFVRRVGRADRADLRARHSADAGRGDQRRDRQPNGQYAGRICRWLALVVWTVAWG